MLETKTFSDYVAADIGLDDYEKALRKMDKKSIIITDLKLNLVDGQKAGQK